MPKTKFPKTQRGLVPLERSKKMIEAIENSGVDLGITAKQAWQIISPTPERFIRTRPGKAGRTWKYVPVRFFELKMFAVFGLNWKFEITDTKYSKEEIIVKGRLTIILKNGSVVIREQYGGAKKKEKMEVYNLHKAAVSDAFKRCCIQLGLFADVYAPMMAIEDKEAIPEGEFKPEQPAEPIADEDIPVID